MEKKMWIAGIALLVLAGLAVADANRTINRGLDTVQADGEGCHGKNFAIGFKAGNSGITDSLGLPENATREQIQDALYEKKLADLGLTDESTIGELRAALKEKRQDKLKEKLEELGLPEDATQEDIRQAMRDRWDGKKGPRVRGMFGKGMPCKST